MRGDFSEWNKDRSQNFRGNLHQQGRVLLDRDWNAQTEIFNEWQDTAGRDAFGAGVAAVPAEVPDSFKVTKAELVGGTSVDVSLLKGRVWADGLLAELHADEPPPAGSDAVRTATYLNPPPGQVGDLPNNLRDAVILETWLEELSPFQRPDLLIEPALGDVDTTERVQTAFRFRLYRMADGETCDSIIPKLKDDFSLKGKLTAKLQPDIPIDGDCPVVQGGGYTGFEHQLYRVEIAETERANQSWFKWSQFNGGLVGRGFFDAANSKVVVKANTNAIVHSGVNNFYLEAMEFDSKLGHWKVIYGARNVTLNSDHTLTLPAAAGDKFIGAIPPSPVGTEKLYFFRLWNGIERVNDYTAEKDLPDLVGIKLEFEPEAAGKYTPHDFWTFSVRAGEVGNPQVLVNNLPPQGIFYHRVPLAEVNWTGNVVTGDDIEDCRRIFQPLTKLKTCCTYRVGDGVNSHGDFTSIRKAIKALPKEGGEVCILPGLYEENLVLKEPHNRNIILRGCGKRTVIRFENEDPVIHVVSGRNIRIESLAVEAHENGFGILLEGNERNAKDGPKEQEKYLENIILTDLCVTSLRKCAIKGHTAQFLTLSRSTIYIKDVDTTCSAVYLAGDDMLIERNEIRVLSDRAAAVGAGDEHSNDPARFVAARLATGGLQVGGGSERVRILNNLIINGIGNGITLGRIDLEKDGKVVDNHDPVGRGSDHIHDICNPDDGYTDDDEETEDGFIPVAGPPLYDIRIKFNRIFNMGRNGIGVATFFSMGKEFDPNDTKAISRLTVRGIISVNKLVIDDNRIEHCVNIAPQPIPEKMTALMGYGGISLADTGGLVIRDNSIVDNGPSFLEPICGIFVLRSEGLEISRNHIINNGMRTDEVLSAGTVKNGLRGGILVVRAETPAVGISFSQDRPEVSRGFGSVAFASGEPAAKIQENIVTVPVGRSLTLFANGAVSVIGNQFTSFGIQPVAFDELVKIFVSSGGKLTPGAKIQLLGLLAGNILIFDIGTAVWLPSQSAGFENIKSGDAANGANYEMKESYLAGGQRGMMTSQKKFQRFFANGAVLFSNNQCHQNLATPEASFAVCSIFIVTLDDIGFLGNQCDCDLQEDIMLMNAFVFGATARVSDNRFRETVVRVLFSAIVLGIMNSTTDNHSVHCLIVAGLLYVDRHNLILFEMFLGLTGNITDEDVAHRCDGFLKFLQGFGGRYKPQVNKIPEEQANAGVYSKMFT